MTRHGRGSTSSSILGWQMRECPLSRHLGMEAPASPVPPTLAGAFSFQLAMTPLLEGCYVVQGEPSNAAMLDLCINASGLHWAEAVFAQGGFHAHNRGCSNLVRCSFAFQWGAR